MPYSSSTEAQGINIRVNPQVTSYGDRPLTIHSFNSCFDEETRHSTLQSQVVSPNLKHLSFPVMSSLFNTFRASARPVATGAFGLFFSTPAWTRGASSGTAARCTKFLVRNPSEIAPRECPTPLILLRAKGIASDEASSE
jgi:hypothetical protein